MPQIPSYFASLEQQYGIPSGILASTYGIESGYGANPGTSSGGAQGPFQFEPQTFAAYGSGDVYNLQDSATAAANYYKDLQSRFVNEFGYQPSAGDLYVGYNQGNFGAFLEPDTGLTRNEYGQSPILTSGANTQEDFIVNANNYFGTLPGEPGGGTANAPLDVGTPTDYNGYGIGFNTQNPQGDLGLNPNGLGTGSITGSFIPGQGDNTGTGAGNPASYTPQDTNFTSGGNVTEPFQVGNTPASTLSTADTGPANLQPSQYQTGTGQDLAGSPVSSRAVTAAGQSVGNAVNAFSGAVSGAAKAIGAENQALSGTWLQWAQDSIVRIFVVVLGLVFVGAALFLFGKNEVRKIGASVAKTAGAVV